MKDAIRKVSSALVTAALAAGVTVVGGTARLTLDRAELGAPVLGDVLIQRVGGTGSNGLAPRVIETLVRERVGGDGPNGLSPRVITHMVQGAGR